MNNAGKHKERDAKIQAMRKDGVFPSDIAERMGLSRNAVLGVLHRAGLVMTLEDRKRAQGAGGKKGAKRAKEISDDAARKRMSALRGKAPAQAKEKPPKPVSSAKLPDPPLPPEKAAPPSAVLFEHRTGCAWPWGDSKLAPLLFCNAPKCKVKDAWGFIVTTPYCEAHWRARRTSAHSKVVSNA